MKVKNLALILGVESVLLVGTVTRYLVKSSEVITGVAGRTLVYASEKINHVDTKVALKLSKSKDDWSRIKDELLRDKTPTLQKSDWQVTVDSEVSGGASITDITGKETESTEKVKSPKRVKKVS